jgi:hypothetical protein
MEIETGVEGGTEPLSLDEAMRHYYFDMRDALHFTRANGEELDYWAPAALECGGAEAQTVGVFYATQLIEYSKQNADDLDIGHVLYDVVKTMAAKGHMGDIELGFLHANRPVPRVGPHPLHGALCHRSRPIVNHHGGAVGDGRARQTWENSDASGGADLGNGTDECRFLHGYRCR